MRMITLSACAAGFQFVVWSAPSGVSAVALEATLSSSHLRLVSVLLS